ncbi:MAG: hypothetical protein KDD38_01900 [Bdellovibrionales bacterium]|nr:hypothetical protein [Bdellovibrionales bacterium]
MISLKNLDIKKLEYIILPGSPAVGFRHLNLHNRVYLYWREFWKQVYGSAEGVDGDFFMRQNFVPVVMYGDEIVAMHLYTLFNPRAMVTKDHTYFHSYPPEFFDYLAQQNIDSVMSIESLTVNPEWRKSKIGLSLGETMIGCSLKFVEVLNVGAAIAPTRNDRGVNKMCYNFNFDCYKANLNYRGFEVDLVCGIREKVTSNPDSRINDLINWLWQSRTDLSGVISINRNLNNSQEGKYGEPKGIAV